MSITVQEHNKDMYYMGAGAFLILWVFTRLMVSGIKPNLYLFYIQAHSVLMST